MALVRTASLSARLRRELPAASPLPATLQTLACRRWPLAYLEHCNARYGERFTIYPIDMAPLVFLCKPDDIRAVVNAPSTALHPGAGAGVLTPIVGDESFMLGEEEEHMAGRTAITPAFRLGAVRAHAQMLDEVISSAVRSWPVGQAFSLHPHLRAMSLRVILRTVFGREDRLLTQLHGRLFEMLGVTDSLVLQEPRLRHLPGWRGTWGRFVKHREQVDRLIYTLIAQGRRERGGEGGQCGGDGQETAGEGAGGEGAGGTLERLLAARNPDGSPMSDRQVRDNLMSVILAGHETTASALAWAFQLLAHHPEVQQRLVEEIDAEAGDAYLTATVQEVLRHRPVFLFTIPRAVVEPIEIGGFTYRPPAHLLGCIYLMHHDPALFADPHEFRPERFLAARPPPRIWMPWGGGRKRCPGHHLAALEMREVLRNALALYSVLPVGDTLEQARWRSVIVTPRDGSRVILRKRRR